MAASFFFFFSHFVFLTLRQLFQPDKWQSVGYMLALGIRTYDRNHIEYIELTTLVGFPGLAICSILLLCPSKRCYQLAVSRSNAFPMAVNLTFMSCLIIANGCYYQFAVLRSKVFRTIVVMNLQFIRYLGRKWVLPFYKHLQQCFSKWLLVICNHQQQCISKWLLQICSLSASLASQVCAINWQLSAAMYLQMVAINL